MGFVLLLFSSYLLFVYSFFKWPSIFRDFVWWVCVWLVFPNGVFLVVLFDDLLHCCFIWIFFYFFICMLSRFIISIIIFKFCSCKIFRDSSYYWDHPPWIWIYWNWVHLECSWLQRRGPRETHHWFPWIAIFKGIFSFFLAISFFMCDLNMERETFFLALNWMLYSQFFMSSLLL